MACPNGKSFCLGPDDKGPKKKCIACEKTAKNTPPPVVVPHSPPRQPPKPSAPKITKVVPPKAVHGPVKVHVSAPSSPSPQSVAPVVGGNIVSSGDAKSKFREMVTRVSTWDDNIKAVANQISSNAREYPDMKVPAEWYSLDEEEQVAIWMYTKQYFRFWNTAMYKNDVKKLTQYAAAIEVFKTAIAKLPLYGNQIYRGENKYSPRHDKFVPKAEMTIPAFWSTTHSLKVLEDPQFGKAVVFNAKAGHKGRLIEFVSASPKEREVLFLPNATFTVETRTGDSKKNQSVEIGLVQKA